MPALEARKPTPSGTAGPTHRPLFSCPCPSLCLNCCLKDLHRIERHSYAAPGGQTKGDGTQNQLFVWGLKKKKKHWKFRKGCSPGLAPPHTCPNQPLRGGQKSEVEEARVGGFCALVWRCVSIVRLSKEARRPEPAEIPVRWCTGEPYHAGPGWPWQ